MKKLLGIVVLGLLLSGNAYANEDNNLRLLKEFNLGVDHFGQCDGENYVKELTTNAKYLFSNSKIKISKKAKEYISIFVHTLDNEAKSDTCVSKLSLQVYSYGMIENSAGVEWFHSRIAYEKDGLAWNAGNNFKKNHREAIMRAFDQIIKQLIIDWNEAQG